MPDGSVVGFDQEVILERVQLYMGRQDFAVGAMAWLCFQFPSKYGEHDSEALALHFLLFARSSLYWSRLCTLFKAVGLQDVKGWHR